MRSSVCLRLHPLMPRNRGKPQAKSRVTAQFIMRASVAERGIVLDFAINKHIYGNSVLY